MKQGLSLRVSQHLALTPQLQQSIRLLQLSTLELAQEVEQMLDDNPFLERQRRTRRRARSSASSQADTPPPRGRPRGRLRRRPGRSQAPTPSAARRPHAEAEAAPADSDAEPDWDGDGSTEMVPDDGEWGGDAPARTQQPSGDDDDVDATELARSQESLQAYLHRQALSLRLCRGRPRRAALPDRIAQRRRLPRGLAAGAGRGPGAATTWSSTRSWCTTSPWRCACCSSLEPAGVGARILAECLTLQLRALQAASAGRRRVCPRPCAICKQPMDLLARRDVKRLAAAVRRAPRPRIKAAIAPDHAAGAQAGPPLRRRRAQHRRARRAGHARSAAAASSASACSSIPT